MGAEGVDEDMVFDKKKAYEIFHEKYIKGDIQNKYPKISISIKL